jgi:protein-S-isoprenylcysteine O-methyltransferase Ste14
MDEATGRGTPGHVRLAGLVISRFIPGMIVLGAAIFAPAGRFAWINAWLYMGTVVVFALLALAWPLARDSALLEKRMETREREKPQRRIVAAWLVLSACMLALPGFDRRFGWSHVPIPLGAPATVLLATGCAIFIFVLRANSWASNVVEVQEGQRLVDTGPYALVRHPLYFANCFIYIATPLVLGSWWALIPAALCFPLLAMRIRNEEEVLGRGLPGYAGYMTRVRWRLVPGLW